MNEDKRRCHEDARKSASWRGRTTAVVLSGRVRRGRCQNLADDKEKILSVMPLTLSFGDGFYLQHRFTGEHEHTLEGDKRGRRDLEAPRFSAARRRHGNCLEPGRGRGQAHGIIQAGSREENQGFLDAFRDGLLG